LSHIFLVLSTSSLKRCAVCLWSFDHLITRELWPHPISMSLNRMCSISLSDQIIASPIPHLPVHFPHYSRPV
jgi:hypothetical protein